MKKFIVACCVLIVLFCVSGCERNEVHVTVGNEILPEEQDIILEEALYEDTPIVAGSQLNTDTANGDEINSKEIDTETSEDPHYWVDEADPWGPTESIVSDERRMYVQTEYKKGYELIKGQAWDYEIGEEHLRNNISLLLDALSQLSSEEVPKITYAQMKTSALSENLETYIGELVFWATAHIDKVTLIEEANSDQEFNKGKAFYIVEATTKHNEFVRIYIMDTNNIFTWYQVGTNHSLRGWIVGADERGVVLCVPSLSGG